MKIALKFALALATCLSLSTAIAAPTTETFVSGTGTLNFQDNYLRSQGLLRVSTRPMLINPDRLPVNTASYNQGTRVVSLTHDSAAVSETDGKVAFSTADSHVELYSVHQREDDDGNMLPSLYLVLALDNITIDLGSASVYADVSSKSGTGEAFPVFADFGRLEVFKGLTPIANGTQGSIINGQASGSTADLRLTSAAADIVISALFQPPGYPPRDPQSDELYRVALTSSWGTASASGTFTSAVPEASAQALMFMGLLPILVFSVRARRR